MAEDRAWCDFAATMLARRLERMFAQKAGVLAADSVEPVHQMRVWSRRSRAAYELLLSCDDSKESQKLEQELKRIGNALAKARDLDVMIDNLEARAAKLPEDQRVGIQSFVGRLSSQRLDAQDGVISAMHRIDHKHLEERFDALLTRRGKKGG